jgi:hypothetical protein
LRAALPAAALVALDADEPIVATDVGV